jgi:predicted O-linked N-acetylglucosamine transferase (SPINDLY family)
VGLVSYDFYRDSSVPFFILPLYQHRDRSQCELITYQLSKVTDEGTQRFRSMSDAWHHLEGISDDDLARHIIADRIDIVLEIHGHTGVRRILPAFQPRCAPVQVSYVGYSNTTGLRSMDWRVVDSNTDPAPAADRLATERLYRLDPCFLCYTPRPDAPEPVPAPSLAAGHITFGAFSELLKLNDATLRLWSHVVSAVPNSRLLLKNRAGDRPDAASFLRSRLQGAGLDPSRVVLLPRTATFLDHLRAYHHLDIALDTVPYNGTTTVCESLFMGVPMVALSPPPRWDRHSARVAMSILTAAGLPELVAKDEDDFVRMAADLAADPRRLNDFRTRLRASFLASPVCDAPAFARRFGEALRFIWRDRCARA